jgi:hypothetical protein
MDETLGLHQARVINPEYFAELFILAQESLRRPRERLAVELRYGFGGGEPHTLEEIGQDLGVSPERARQLLNKAHRKIVGRGMSQIRSAKHNGECAELLLCVRNAVLPEANGVAERIVEFAEEVMPHLPTSTHALPLIATLAFSKEANAKAHLAEARQLLRQRESVPRDRNRATTRLKELLSDAIWSDQLRLFAGAESHIFQRAREVSPVGTGNAGSFYSEKLKRDVQYESVLEHDFLRCVEQVEDVLFYQEQPLAISYSVGDLEHAYYPDLLLILSDGRAVVVEIKPVFHMALERNLIKWGALRKFCAEAGLGLLVTDGRRSIQQVQRHKVKPEFESTVLSALQGGPLFWTEYRAIKNRFEPGRDDSVALILRHRLKWQLSPFALRLP